MLSSVFISISIFLMPITVVPDEGFHATESWKIFHRPIDQDTGNFFSLSEYQNGMGTRRTFAENEEVPVDQDPDAFIITDKYKKLFTNKVDLSNSELHFSFSLQIVRYLPQAIGMLIGSFIYPSYGVIITLGRIFSALTYMLAVYFIIKYMRTGKLVMMMIALLPMMVQQAGSLSYDVLNNIVIFTFSAFYINLLCERKLDRKKIVILCAITFLLFATKSNSLLLLLLLFFTRFTYNDSNSIFYKIIEFYQKNRRIILIILSLIAVVGFILFTKSHGGLKQIGLMWLNSLVNTHLNTDINSVIFVGIFGYFGWLDIMIPLWLIYIDIIVLTLVFLQEKSPKVYLIEGLASLGVIVLEFLSVVLVMFFWTIEHLDASTNISIGSQGRYFTPFLILILPFVFSLRDRVKFHVSKSVIIRTSCLILILNFLMYLYQILEFYWF